MIILYNWNTKGRKKTTQHHREQTTSDSNIGLSVVVVFNPVYCWWSSSCTYNNILFVWGAKVVIIETEKGLVGEEENHTRCWHIFFKKSSREEEEVVAQQLFTIYSTAVHFRRTPQQHNVNAVKEGAQHDIPKKYILE